MQGSAYSLSLCALCQLITVHRDAQWFQYPSGHIPTPNDLTGVLHNSRDDAGKRHVIGDFLYRLENYGRKEVCPELVSRLSRSYLAMVF